MIGATPRKLVAVESDATAAPYDIPPIKAPTLYQLAPVIARKRSATPPTEGVVPMAILSAQADVLMATA